MRLTESPLITMVLIANTTTTALDALMDDENALKRYTLPICPNYAVDVVWKDVSQQFRDSIKDSEYNFLKSEALIIDVDTIRNIEPAYQVIRSTGARDLCVLVIQLSRSDIDRLWQIREQKIGHVSRYVSIDKVKIPLDEIRDMAHFFLKTLPELKHAEFEFWLWHKGTKRGVRFNKQKEIFKIFSEKIEEFPLKQEKIRISDSSFKIRANFPSVVFSSSYEPTESSLKVFIENVNKYCKKYELDINYPSLQDNRYIISLIRETDLYYIVPDENFEIYFVSSPPLNDFVFDKVLSELLIITQLLCETNFVDTLSGLRGYLLQWVDYLDEWYRGREQDDPLMNREIRQDIYDIEMCLKNIDGSIRLSEERLSSFRELFRNTASKLILNGLETWQKFIHLVPKYGPDPKKIEDLKNIPVLPIEKTRFRKAIEWILDLVIIGFLVNFLAGLMLQYDPTRFLISLILLGASIIIRILLF